MTRVILLKGKGKINFVNTFCNENNTLFYKTDTSCHVTLPGELFFGVETFLRNRKAADEEVVVLSGFNGTLAMYTLENLIRKSKEFEMKAIIITCRKLFGFKRLEELMIGFYNSRYDPFEWYDDQDTTDLENLITDVYECKMVPHFTKIK